MLIIEPYFNLCLKFSDYTNIIVSLLPAVITIISISLQIHDDSIYNVKIRDYQNIRTSIHFNLLLMVIVSIFTFIFELATCVFHRPLTSIVLALIAAFYSLLFAITELPILMKSEKTIHRIIRSFLIKNKENLLNENSIFDKAIKNFVLIRGVKEAFNKLRSKDIKDDFLLFLLLSRQNQFLSDYIDYIKAYKENIFVKYNGINIVDVLPNIYSSISDLTDLNDSFNYLIYDKDGQNIYLLTRLSFLVNSLNNELSLSEDKAVEWFKRILLHYHWRNEKNIHSPFFNNYIL